MRSEAASAPRSAAERRLRTAPISTLTQPSVHATLHARASKVAGCLEARRGGARLRLRRTRPSRRGRSHASRGPGAPDRGRPDRLPPRRCSARATSWSSRSASSRLPAKSSGNATRMAATAHIGSRRPLASRSQRSSTSGARLLGSPGLAARLGDLARRRVPAPASALEQPERREAVGDGASRLAAPTVRLAETRARARTRALQAGRSAPRSPCSLAAIAPPRSLPSTA